MKAATDGQSNGSVQISQLFGGEFPYSFLWSNGATTASATGLAAGPISLTITDGVGCTATFSFVVDAISATEKSENEAAEIRLEPNPTTHSTRLFLPKSWASKSLEIALFRADGRLVWQQLLNKNNNEFTDIELENEPSGLFWIGIKSRDDGRAVFKKIVKI